MFYRAENQLAVRGRPVFLGMLKVFDDGEVVTLSVDDIESITFSLFKTNADTLGEYSRHIGSTPVEHWQEIPLDKNEVITEPKTYDPEFYSVLQLKPFESNFRWYPPNNPLTWPPLFATAGIYEASFEIVDTDGEVHAHKIELTVK